MSADEYASFLTYVALDPGDIFSDEELADATHKLPPSSLESAARLLTRVLEGASERQEEYWENRILPYLNNIWPKSTDKMTPTISESFAQLCVAAGDGFPAALAKLKDWIQPSWHSDYLLELIIEAKLCERFPEDVLALLNKMIQGGAPLIPSELSLCLDIIRQTNHKLSSDPRYFRLSELTN